jgi:Acyl-CoA dehydrogenase, N-terminal domain
MDCGIPIHQVASIGSARPPGEIWLPSHGRMRSCANDPNDCDCRATGEERHSFGPKQRLYEVYETLSVEELATVKRVRTFMEAKVAPVITKYWVDDAFPFELLPGVKELGIGGLAMHGYGCAGAR